MREDFLHYVWRFKKLNNTSLKTVQNNEVVIKDFGLYLGTEGPDFLTHKFISTGNYGQETWKCT